MDWLLNIFRRWWQRRVEKQFLRCVQDEMAEEFLELLLRLMKLAFKLDRDFRRNIAGFAGRYLFRSRDGSITMAAVFDGGELSVKEQLISDAHASVVFKDARSLMNYLLADRDILKMVLNNEVTIEGNMNYVLKFGYMANHLQLALAGRLP